MQTPWLHRYAILVAVCTLFLVVAGASVTSKEAGLSVPDWPLSYGQVIPEMTGGVLFETGHRMIATVVGIADHHPGDLDRTRREAQRGCSKLGWLALGRSRRAGIAGRRYRAPAAACADQHRACLSRATFLLRHRGDRRLHVAQVAGRSRAGGRLRLAVFAIARDPDSRIGSAADRRSAQDSAIGLSA